VHTGRGRDVERPVQGIAVVPNDISHAVLAELKSNGVVGVAYNVALLGVGHYPSTAPLLAQLAALDLCINVQVKNDQMSALSPLLARSAAQIAIDHCGRPDLDAGVDAPGFRAVLDLARTSRDRHRAEPQPLR
jgi:predicted TIM-barrel fold metal-dependent hydrolase